MPLMGTSGAACGGRALKPENFLIFFEKFDFFVTKLRESVGNRSQMVSGCIRDVCDALARVSALPELQKPPKFTENQEPESKSLTVP